MLPYLLKQFNSVTNYAADHNVNGTKAGVTGSPFETCVTDQ